MNSLPTTKTLPFTPHEEYSVNNEVIYAVERAVNASTTTNKIFVTGNISNM